MLYRMLSLLLIFVVIILLLRLCRVSRVATTHNTVSIELPSLYGVTSSGLRAFMGLDLDLDFRARV